MRSRTWIGVYLILAGLIPGCGTRSTVPLDLASQDPSANQALIADYHRREAAFFKLKAGELRERAVLYENLFGRDSDWVTGARLLAQFYEESAAEQERLAAYHGEENAGRPYRDTVKP